MVIGLMRPVFFNLDFARSSLARTGSLEVYRVFVATPVDILQMKIYKFESILIVAQFCRGNLQYGDYSKSGTKFGTLEMFSVR